MAARRFSRSRPRAAIRSSMVCSLSVAFIDAQGTIINIADMQPHSEETHCATKPALYALEMAQGWFAQRGIKPGMKLGGLDKLR